MLLKLDFSVYRNRLWLLGAIALAVILVVLASGATKSSWSFLNFTDNSNIEMLNAQISSGQVTSGEAVLYTAQFKSSAKAPLNVLIDIEIFDSSNNRVDQHYWDNVRLNPEKTVTYQVTSPEALPPGNYRFWVGIFKPKWGKLIKSYDSHTFTVTSTNQASGNNYAYAQ